MRYFVYFFTCVALYPTVSDRLVAVRASLCRILRGHRALVHYGMKKKTSPMVNYVVLKCVSSNISCRTNRFVGTRQTRKQKRSGYYFVSVNIIGGQAIRPSQQQHCFPPQHLDPACGRLMLLSLPLGQLPPWSTSTPCPTPSVSRAAAAVVAGVDIAGLNSKAWSSKSPPPAVARSRRSEKCLHHREVLPCSARRLAPAGGDEAREPDADGYLRW